MENNAKMFAEIGAGSNKEIQLVAASARIKDLEEQNAALAAHVEELQLCLKERRAVCHQAFDANDALKAERDALAAQVEVLKYAAEKMMFKGKIVSNVCYNIGQRHEDAEHILQAVREYDAEVRNFHDVSTLHGGAK